MKVLIAENGQHVVESCRLMAKKGHKIYFVTPFLLNRKVPNHLVIKYIILQNMM